MQSPILSICIPTYNRAEALKVVLARMTDEAIFRESAEIEIVIADNASTDNTEEICRSFVDLFPEKVRYYRQERNLGPSANLWTLLVAGRGLFLKVQNDVFYFLPGRLEKILSFVKSQMMNRPLLFFGNGACMSGKLLGEENSYDELLEDASYWTTWLGGFGMWREDVASLKSCYEAYADTLIVQTAMLWACFDKRKQARLYNEKIFGEDISSSIRRGGYNIMEVFGWNYLKILKPYVSEGKISLKAYTHERKRLYLGFIFGKYFDFRNQHSYHKGAFWRWSKDFHSSAFFWLSLSLVPLFHLGWFVAQHLQMTSWALGLYGRLKRSIM